MTERVVIFAGTLTEAGFLRGLLEANGIFVRTKDEWIGSIAPWIASAGGAGAVKLLVDAEDAKRASEIVADFFAQAE